jgi:superfamily II DNA helicase RecQ
MRYGAVILSPELAMNSAVMIKFWEKIRSMSMLVRLVIDEAHLMLAWAGFRKLYNNLSTLKHFLPARTDYYLTSATLPNSHLNTIFNNLALLRSNFSIIRRSNDRFNLSYVVRPMSHTKKSKGDLLFLFPDSSAPATDPAPFIIYVQSKADAEQIYDQLLESRSWLKGRIAYIHAEMENGWRDNVVEKFKCGDLIGLIGTDAVGLVGSFINNNLFLC